MGGWPGLAVSGQSRSSGWLAASSLGCGQAWLEDALPVRALLFLLRTPPLHFRLHILSWEGIGVPHWGAAICQYSIPWAFQEKELACGTCPC